MFNRNMENHLEKQYKHNTIWLNSLYMPWLICFLLETDCTLTESLTDHRKHQILAYNSTHMQQPKPCTPTLNYSQTLQTCSPCRWHQVHFHFLRNFLNQCAEFLGYRFSPSLQSTKFIPKRSVYPLAHSKSSRSDHAKYPFTFAPSL